VGQPYEELFSMTPKIKVRAAWLLLCIACIPIAALKPDGGIMFVVPLIILTFPSGLLGLAVYGWIDMATQYPGRWLPGGTAWGYWAAVGIVWVVVAGAGYAQWFVLLPWVGRRWDRLASRGKSSNGSDAN
jgi:hypothetical protein